MKRLFATLLVAIAASAVWSPVAFAQRRALCAVLFHCIDQATSTYAQCKAPGPFVSPEPVCRRALLNSVQVCHARFGFCPG